MSRRGCVNSRSVTNRSEEHTSELQSRRDLVCRLLLELDRGPPHLHSFPTRRSSDLLRSTGCCRYGIARFGEMVSYEGNDVGFVINDEDALRSGALISHVRKLNESPRVRQLAVCHE